MKKHFCDKCMKEIETEEIMELDIYLKFNKFKSSDTFTFELCQECSQHIIDEIDEGIE